MSAQTFYGDAASVLIRTGIDFSDFNLADAPALTTYLEGLLGEISDTFDRYLRTTYLGVVDVNNNPVPVPAGLNGIANDACAYIVAQQIASRQTPVVRVDDFRITVSTSTVLTNDIKDRLKLYAAGRGAVSVDLGQDMLRDLPIIFTADQLDADPADLP